MITVEIPRKDLMRQLPDKAGYALIQWLDEMPERFVFEALPVHTKADVVAKECPEVRAALLPTEWRIFVELYRRGPVRYGTLEAATGLIKGRDLVPTSNMIMVHAKNLRNKLRPLGWDLRTHRGTRYTQGAYELHAPV